MSDVKRTLEDISRDHAAAVHRAARPSIAVLPFADMSAGKDHEWFSDGLSEEIINALVQIPGLRVIARTSSFAFKGKQEDIRRIAEVLGVAHILEGSVRKAGDRIRVTAQLIAAADGSHLWSERYDRDISDVFAIQDEMARTIATTLQLTLTDHPLPIRTRTPLIAAYEAVLKARHLWFTDMTPEGMRQARQLIEHAIALDPTFAEARAILGVHFYLHAVLGLRPARDVVPIAKQHLAAALQIDDELPEAHAVLGALACMYDYDWADAARRFERARLREAVVVARFVREVSEAMLLAIVGRHAQAVELLRQTIKQDPLNPSPHGSLGNVLASAGRLDEAAAEYRHVLELNARSPFAYEGLTIVHASQGRFTEALAAAEKAHALAPWNATGIGMLAGCLQRAGDAGRSQEVLRLLGDGHQFGAPIGFAIHHAINDETEAGAEWLEKAIAERDPRAIVFLVLPTGHVWRRSARWPTLAKTLNLASAVA